MDALAVPETYFWREADQLRAIVDIVVPALVRAQPATPVRIWSVPCATGEEPLTLAMMLQEAGWFDRAAIEIHASDASQAAIAQGAGGALPRALVPQPAAARCASDTSRRDGDDLGDRSGAARARVTLVERRQPDVRRGTWRRRGARADSCSAATCSSISRDAAIRRVRRPASRGAMPSPGYLCVGAVGVAAAGHRRAFELEEIGGAFVYVKP